MSVKRYYDTAGDILYLTFAETARSSRGIQLTENIVLRIHPETGQPLKMIIHNYTRLAALSRDGQGEFRLTGLPEPSSPLHETLLAALKTDPLHEFITLVQSTPSASLCIALTEALLPQPQMAMTA